jgi:hypothetical protein
MGRWAITQIWWAQENHNDPSRLTGPAPPARRSETKRNAVGFGLCRGNGWSRLHTSQLFLLSSTGRDTMAHGSYFGSPCAQPPAAAHFTLALALSSNRDSIITCKQVH